VGAVAGVLSSNGEEGTREHWGNEEQSGGGVILRREQVIRVLFEGKTGTIEEVVVTGECFLFPDFVTTGFICDYDSHSSPLVHPQHLLSLFSTSLPHPTDPNPP